MLNENCAKGSRVRLLVDHGLVGFDGNPAFLRRGTEGELEHDYYVDQGRGRMAAGVKVTVADAIDFHIWLIPDQLELVEKYVHPSVECVEIDRGEFVTGDPSRKAIIVPGESPFDRKHPS